MSWNLFIDANGPSGEKEPMGSLSATKDVIKATFPQVDWHSETECFLDHPDGGCMITLTIEDGTVKYLSTDGGYHQLNELAAMCKTQGWHIADMQEGEYLDLDKPYSMYDQQ
jgi:hypothetical protein